MSDSEPVDPVVAAADRRIRDRGLEEFKNTIDHMSEDPSWAPDPIDLTRAGVPDDDHQIDIYEPEGLDDDLS